MKLNDLQKITLRDAALGAGREAARGATVYAAVNLTQLSKTVAAAVISAVFRIGDEIRRFRDGEISGAACAEAAADICLSAFIGAACAELAAKRIKNPTLAPILGSAGGVFLYELVRAPLKRTVNALPHGETAKS